MTLLRFTVPKKASRGIHHVTSTSACETTPKGRLNKQEAIARRYSMKAAMLQELSGPSPTQSLRYEPENPAVHCSPGAIQCNSLQIFFRAVFKESLRRRISGH